MEWDPDHQASCFKDSYIRSPPQGETPEARGGPPIMNPDAPQWGSWPEGSEGA
jgi:hypothetical protein